jgi:ATP phosphoribosyltransferase
MRKGFLEPLYAVATWDSYAPYFNGKLSQMWSQHGALMLGKCAEMLALRKAFPMELSGLYVQEEMDVATQPTIAVGTGRDWIEETDSDVVSLGELRYSKATAQPVRVIVAVADSSPAQSAKDLRDGVRVTTEYPEMTRRYFANLGIKADIRLSYGASEAKIPDIADCVVDITETGRALRAAGLRIIDTMLTSYTELIANKESFADPVKRHAMEQIMTLLTGTLEARDKVLLKLNVSENAMEKVLALLPAAKSPTVSRLASGDYAIESVVTKRGINTLIPDLIDAGASDLLEIPISKIIH